MKKVSLHTQHFGGYLLYVHILHKIIYRFSSRKLRRIERKYHMSFCVLILFHLYWTRVGLSIIQDNI